MGTTIAKKETSLTGNKGRLKIYQEQSTPNADTIMNLKANIRGLEDEITMLTDVQSPSSFTLAKFNNGVSKVEILQQLHLQARNRLSYDLERFNQLQNTLESDITSLILVETGQVPIVKSRPRRSLIVIASILAALLLGTITALLLDNYRNVNWKEILNA
jgi:tyrosine-protein kinase Etk/Wzc